MKKYGIIDIGSNTIRLSVYQTEQGQVRNLVHKKATVGLAGYVHRGALQEEGIAAACTVLQEYRELLELLGISEFAVFATASLRNITNTEEAVEKIAAKTGFSVTVLSGCDEAKLGYYAIRNEKTQEGILLDVGGGSTDMTAFHSDGTLVCKSIPIGSLNLYAQTVKKLLPTEPEIKALKRTILKACPKDLCKQFGTCTELLAVGGSARAALRLANHMLDLPADNAVLTKQQVRELLERLLQQKKKTIRMILKCCPDRTHTITPGLLILYCLMKRFHAQRLRISPYGIREGYLYRNILHRDRDAATDLQAGRE